MTKNIALKKEVLQLLEASINSLRVDKDSEVTNDIVHFVLQDLKRCHDLIKYEPIQNYQSNDKSFKDLAILQNKVLCVTMVGIFEYWCKLDPLKSCKRHQDARDWLHYLHGYLCKNTKNFNSYGTIIKNLDKTKYKDKIKTVNDLIDNWDELKQNEIN